MRFFRGNGRRKRANEAIRAASFLISRGPHASGFPNIPLPREHAGGPTCSRIALPTDSYVAVPRNPDTYVRIWELRVESTTIREQLTRCLTDQSVLFVVEPAPAVRRAISKIAPRQRHDDDRQ